MKTITAPERSTELLRAGQVMTVTGQALVEWFGEGGIKKGPIAVISSNDIGPFGSDVQLVISALAGEVSFGAGEVDAEALIPYVNGAIGVVVDKIDLPDVYVKTALETIIVDNPYRSGNKALTHSQLIYSSTRFGGYSWWLCATPFNDGDTATENPCIWASNDLQNWVIPQGSNPVVGPPQDTFNADTSLAFNANESRLYLIYRARRTVTGVTTNDLNVLHTVDGKTWTTPFTIKSGLKTTPQDYACPSLWWDKNTSKWQVITHNLDGTDPYPVNILTSSTSDIYGAWGAPVVVSVTPTSGYHFWHSHFVYQNGVIFGVATERPVGGSGGDAPFYLLTSIDAGLTFTKSALKIPIRAYRPSIFFDENGSANFLTSLVGDVYFEILRLMSADEYAAIEAEKAKYFAGTKFAIAYDSFNRADGVAGLGTTENGRTWIADSGTAGIGTNRAYNVTSGSRQVMQTNAADIDIEIDIDTAGASNSAQVILRKGSGGTGGNYIIVGWPTLDNANLYCQTLVGFAEDTNQRIFRRLQDNFKPASGTKLRVVAIGANYSVYINNALVWEFTNTNYLTQTIHGIKLDGASPSQTYINSILIKPV